MIHCHLHGNVRTPGKVYRPENFGNRTPAQALPKLESACDNGMTGAGRGMAPPLRGRHGIGGHAALAGKAAGRENQASSWKPHWQRQTGGNST